MPNKHPLMKLSREEDVFLRHWMYDEVHYRDGPGPAKTLQVRHHVTPAELAEMCDVVGIIEQGRMLAVGSVAEIEKEGKRHAQVRVRVLGGAAALGTWLAERGDVHEILVDGEMATFAHDGDEQSEADLLRDLVTAGFRIAAFGSRVKSLEDVFMQVTEGLVQ